MGFLNTRTEDEHNRITADYLLSGKHMKAKRIPSKNMYKYNGAMSKVFARLEEKLNEFVEGRILTKSALFLNEWEKTAGIPDDSLAGTSNVESRRRQAEMKMSVEGVYSASEWEWICSILGYVVKVYPGWDFWEAGDPRVTFGTKKEAKNTTVFELDRDSSTPVDDAFTFPISWPWQFAANDFIVLQSFVLEYLDANVNALWIDKVRDTIESTFGATDIIEDTFGATDTIEDKVIL